MKNSLITTILFLFLNNILAQNIRGDDIKRILNEVYNECLTDSSGRNAHYIPELDLVPTDLFSIAICDIGGNIYAIGDTSYLFSIQSISKVFTLAKIIDSLGVDTLIHKIGVNATGQAFNSINAIEDLTSRPTNPLVNAGAIASTSLIKGETKEKKWNNILHIFSEFAGRSLSLDRKVYHSESGTNSRNKAIAMLLYSYGRIYADPIETTDIYTKQCATSVHTIDLSIMAATLANSGTNPVTNQMVIGATSVPPILAIMTTAGMYDNSGQWITTVRIPAKSGVGGGIIAVSPGKFGIAAFSPRLDEFGNSVRASKAILKLAEKLELSIFD